MLFELILGLVLCQMLGVQANHCGTISFYTTSASTP